MKLKNKIEYLIDNPQEYQKMKQVAQEKGMKVFSYKNIAKRAVL